MIILIFSLLSTFLLAQEIEKKPAILFINTNTSEKINDEGSSELSTAKDNSGGRILETIGSTTERVNPIITKDKINKLTQTSSIETIIISGHDGGGQFSGEKGSLSRYNIGSIAAENEEFKNSVRTVILLGCYTTVISQVNDWKSIFPNVDIIAGFDGAAPLSERPQGHKYLKELLNGEKELIGVKDIKKLNKIIPSVNQPGFKPAISFCEEDDNKAQTIYHYSSQTKKLQSLKERLKECIDNYNEIKEAASFVRKLKEGVIDQTNSPVKISHYYRMARNYEDCYQLIDSKRSWELPQGITSKDILINNDDYLRLIYINKVKENFSRFHKNEFKELKRVLGIKESQNLVTAKRTIPTLEEFTAEAKKSRHECLRLLNLTRYNFLNESYQSFAQGLKDQNLNIDDYYDLENLSFKISDIKNFRQSISNESTVKNLRLLETYTSNAGKCDDNSIKRKYDSIVACNEKKFYIPDENFLKTNSRKEILKNLHDLNGYRACMYENNIYGIEKKQSEIWGLDWLDYIYSFELEHLRVPLSWIDIQKTTEAPFEYETLSDFMKRN